jgi:hypothetical protein
MALVEITEAVLLEAEVRVMVDPVGMAPEAVDQVETVRKLIVQQLPIKVRGVVILSKTHHRQPPHL